MAQIESLSGPKVGYFSMEYCVTPELPIYSGGLGVLAGDHLKAASDLGVPIVGIGIFYHYGYFTQDFNTEGKQVESYPRINPGEAGIDLITDSNDIPISVSLDIEDRQVQIQAYLKQVDKVPLILLTTDVDENSQEDRMITGHLYGAESDTDTQTRVRQEMVLGMGGKRMLDRLGANIGVYHMNEGHSAFLTLERVEQLMKSGLTAEQALKQVQKDQFFTNHTLVRAGNDIFPGIQVTKELSSHPELLSDFETIRARANHLDDAPEGSWSQAKFAISTSFGTTAVSRIHSETAAITWGIGKVDYVTNGVHHSWMDNEMKALIDPDQDRFIRLHTDPNYLRRRMEEVDPQDFRDLRNKKRAQLSEFANRYIGQSFFAPDVLTIGFGRRAATYKRLDLLFGDPEKLEDIFAASAVQIIMAAKAHPRDEAGKDTIQRLVQLSKDKRFRSNVLFVPDYNSNIAHQLVVGSDVWLNTPKKYEEASGTSGMKSAMNGGRQWSVDDGWMNEVPDDLYFKIEDDQDPTVVTARILRMLGFRIIPDFYNRDYNPMSPHWTMQAMASMEHVIANFSASRMTREYDQRFYQPALQRVAVPV